MVIFQAEDTQRNRPIVSHPKIYPDVFVDQIREFGAPKKKRVDFTNFTSREDATSKNGGPSQSHLELNGSWIDISSQSIYSGIGFEETISKTTQHALLEKTIPYYTHIRSMYGTFTNIYHTNHPNVGKYTIHGAFFGYDHQ